MQNRPAETGGGLLAVAVIIARVFTTDPNVLTAVGAVAGAVPGAITWLIVQFRGKP